MGVRIPNGTRATDLPQPAPQASAIQANTAAATQQAASLPTADTQSLLAEYDKYSQQTQGLLQQFDAQGAQIQGPPEATLATPSTGLVRRADGQLVVQESDGKIRDLTDKERKAAEYISHGLRLGGPVVGGMLGGAAGGLVGGPVGANVGGAAGAVAGSELADPAARLADEVARTPAAPERTNMQRGIEFGVGVVAPPILTALGRAASSAAGQILGRETPAAVEAAAVANKGGQVLDAAAEARAAAGREANIKLFPEEVNRENLGILKQAEDVARGAYGKPAQDRLQAGLAARDADYVKRFQDLRATLPDVTEEALAEKGPRKAIADFITGHETNLSGLKKEVYRAAGDQKFNAAPVDTKFRELADKLSLFDSSGQLSAQNTGADRAFAKEYQRFLGETAGDVSFAGGPGGPNDGAQLSVKQMDSMLSRVGDRANFGSYDRSPAERAFGELYHDLRVTRDTAAAQAMDKVNPQVAQNLRAARDSYSQNIDSLRGFEKLVDADPYNVARVLVKRDSPDQVRALKQVLPKESFDLVRAQVLDGLMAGVDATKRSVNATGMEKELAKYGKTTLNELFSPAEQGELRSLINVGKVIEQRRITSSAEAAKDPTVQRFMKIATQGQMSQVLGEAWGYLSRLVNKNRAVQEYFADTMVKKFPQQTAIQIDRAARGARTAEAVVKALGNPVVQGAAAGAAQVGIGDLTK